MVKLLVSFVVVGIISKRMKCLVKWVLLRIYAQSFHLVR